MSTSTRIFAIISAAVLGLTLAAEAQPQAPASAEAPGAKAKRGARSKAKRAQRQAERDQRIRAGTTRRLIDDAPGLTANDPATTAIEVQLRRRRFRSALPSVRTQLGLKPDDPNLHAAMALICNGFGDYSCSYVSAGFAVGSSIMPRETIGVWANALRANGEGAAAAAARRDLRWFMRSDEDLARLYALIGRDLSEAGLEADADEAFAAAASYDPTSNALQREEIARAIRQGDLDEAEFLLWRGLGDGTLKGSAWVESELALAIAADDLDTLTNPPKARLKETLSGVELTAMRARARVRADDHPGALELLDRTTFQIWGETFHPELLLARADAERAAGDPSAAAATLDDLAQLSPRHPHWARWGERAPNP